MSKIGSIGSSAATAVLPETQAPAAKADTKASPEIAANTTVQQDPKDKVSDLKMEGQTREAQVRAQFGANPQFKMPGVDVKGPNLDDPKIQNGFKEFDKSMPSVDIKWPEKGEFKETKDKDGATHREMTDANGTQFKEKVDKNGSRERECGDGQGNKQFEIRDKKSWMKGFADDKGNSYSVDSDGTSTRMHHDKQSEKQYLETSYKDGSKIRSIAEKNGDIRRENIDANGNRTVDDFKNENGVTSQK